MSREQAVTQRRGAAGGGPPGPQGLAAGPAGMAAGSARVAAGRGRSQAGPGHAAAGERKVAPVPDNADFAQAADPFRRELLAHCYRMLGSVHEAEDLVQETYLRAWRAYPGFDDDRASLRTWLYRIATNACLTALKGRDRRPLPSGLGSPADDPQQPLVSRPEVPWLQPVPDAMLDPAPDDPAAIVASRAGIRLAFIAALQCLPARQRAVLILRDVLAMPAAEVASLLGSSTAAVNSALQRAHAQLARVAPAQDLVAEPPEAEKRELLDRYVAAFVHADVDGLERLLADDVVLEMPPFLDWFSGRVAVEAFLTSNIGPPHRAWQMFPVGANGQLAIAAYRRKADGRQHAHSVQVLGFSATGIEHITAFLEPALLAAFGLPAVWPADPSAAGAAC